MNKVIVFAVALLLVTSSWSGQDTKPIEEAILGWYINIVFAGSHQSTRPAPELRIKVEKVFGEYAKAKISSTDGTGETETAYLRKQNETWVVLDLGTGVDPHELGIPINVW